MAKLVKFKYYNGEPIAINPDRVTKVEPSPSDPTHTNIWFDTTNEYATVDGDFDIVVLALNKG